MGRKKKQESPKEQIYEIKSILKYEKRRGKDFYLVEWEGYPLSEATWEPRSNFIDVGSEILDKLNALKESGDSEKKVEELDKSLKNDKKSEPDQPHEKKKIPLKKKSGGKRVSALWDECAKSAIHETNKTSDLLDLSTQTKSLFSESDTHFSNPTDQRSTDSVAVLEDSRPTTNKPESSMKRRKMNVKELVHDEEEPKNNMDLHDISQPLDQDAAPHTSCLGETVPTHVDKSHKPKTKAGTSLAKHSKEHQSRPKSGKNTKDIMTSAFLGIPALSSSSSPSAFPQKSASYMDSNDETPAIHESATQESTTVKDKRDDNNHVDLDKSLKPLEGCNQVPTSIRVKSIRQDATHGLCGIISTTLSTGIVEESRMPISDVRVQYPDELIEFLLQRIQFRSVRPASLNGNLPLPPVTTA